MPKTTASISVPHIAQLANIPLTNDEEKKLEVAFDDTIKVIDELREVPVDNVAATYQVTGLENVLREDVVDESRMFSQDEALANAKQKADGYFVVPQIISQD